MSRQLVESEYGIPHTLVETLDFANPELHPGIYVAVKTLLTYPGCKAKLQQHEEAQNATLDCYVRCEVVLAVSDPSS